MVMTLRQKVIKHLPVLKTPTEKKKIVRYFQSFTSGYIAKVWEKRVLNHK